MSDVVIQVDNLGKKYLIRHEQRERYVALRDVMAKGIKNFGRKILSPITVHHSPFTDSKEEFWALKDVSFEINQGDRVGIIGRNGAGKTTLLKLISRITEPTTGRITLKGRVASLLEVGTGFHPELTGRENIFLNGAILGMGKSEIKRKFDEIVDFAEVEKFLDTPVKRYSSGMYVRLAFAVAAHLEPEILIVDEVLAVGDAEFQKKCLGKMQEVGKEGRTVLFVSHNTSAVIDLCDKCLLLKSGSIIMSGSSANVVKYYLDKGNKLYTAITLTNLIDNKNEVYLVNAKVCQNDRVTTVVNCREEFKIVFEYQINKVVSNCRIFLMFRNLKGEIIFCTSDCDELLQEAVERKEGRFVSTVVIQKNLMKIGTVYITIGADVKGERYIFVEDDILEFDVIEIGGNQLCERHVRDGLVAPIFDWTIREIY